MVSLILFVMWNCERWHSSQSTCTFKINSHFCICISNVWECEWNFWIELNWSIYRWQDYPSNLHPWRQTYIWYRVLWWTIQLCIESHYWKSIPNHVSGKLSNLWYPIIFIHKHFGSDVAYKQHKLTQTWNKHFFMCHLNQSADEMKVIWNVWDIVYLSKGGFH